jgi:hypothetical protein
MFGVDCSFLRDQRHAGPHTGRPQPITTVAVGERTFKTTPQMIQSAQEFCEFLRTADAEVNFHGDGLIQTLAHSIKKEKRNG